MHGWIIAWWQYRNLRIKMWDFGWLDRLVVGKLFIIRRAGIVINSGVVR